MMGILLIGQACRSCKFCDIEIHWTQMMGKFLRGTTFVVNFGALAV
jgi:hypothetical protein